MLSFISQNATTSETVTDQLLGNGLGKDPEAIVYWTESHGYSYTLDGGGSWIAVPAGGGGAANSIIDDLLATTSGKVLDARQGNILDQKITTLGNDTTPVDNLASALSDKSLSANQGRELKSLIDAQIPVANVVDQTGTGVPLSASMGWFLNEEIKKLLPSNDLTVNDVTKTMAIAAGFRLAGRVQILEDAGIVNVVTLLSTSTTDAAAVSLVNTNATNIANLQPIDDVVTASASAPLSANQGTVLKGLIDALGPTTDLGVTVVGQALDATTAQTIIDAAVLAGAGGGVSVSGYHKPINISTGGGIDENKIFAVKSIVAGQITVLVPVDGIFDAFEVLDANNSFTAAPVTLSFQRIGGGAPYGTALLQTDGDNYRFWWDTDALQWMAQDMVTRETRPL